MSRSSRWLAAVFAIAVTGCGSPDQVDVELVLPSADGLACGSGTVAGLAATLFVSGNIAPCDLTIVDGVARGDCGGIPTGIERFLVLRYTVAAGRALPLRYALTRADLTAAHLEGSSSKIPITFVNDGVTGMYVDTDADVARLRDLLYGPRTSLYGAMCFARSVIATDAGTVSVAGDCRANVDVDPILDLDGDACTNLRELCDGTSPVDNGSGATCVN